jgi:hypothetical protein
MSLKNEPEREMSEEEKDALLQYKQNDIEIDNILLGIISGLDDLSGKAKNIEQV